MADEGSNAPRRALDPSGDASTSPRAGGRFARAYSPDEPATESRGGRFAVSPAEPPRPAPPLDIESLSRYSRVTPPEPSPQAGRMVPPPMPVLPEPEAALPPARGRRFSASTEPNEFAPAAPERSAASPMSPLTASEPATWTTSSTSFSSVGYTSPADDSFTDPGQEATDQPSGYPDQTANYGTWNRFPASPTSPATTAFPSVPEAETEFADTEVADTEVAEAEESSEEVPVRGLAALTKRGKAKKSGKTKEKGAGQRQSDTEVDYNPSPEILAKPKSARPALLVIIAVLVVALLAAATVWFITRNNGNTGGGTSINSEALDPLVTAADLGQVGGLVWEANTSTTDDTRPLCTSAEQDGVAEPQRHLARVTRATGSEDRLVQRFDTYADDATATTAYAGLLAQISTCTADVVWMTGGNSVTGLADESTAIRVRIQAEGGDVSHVLLLSRTGRSVSLLDLGTTQVVKPLELAQVAGASLSRQCGPDKGTCPTNIEVAATLPPPGDPVGWLIEADLPRINPGIGRWGAQPVGKPSQFTGSLCEAINLETESGADSVNIRTLLYADDPAQPSTFGVDMLTYTFKDAKGAADFSKKLDDKISTCPPRLPTAKVDSGPAVKGTGNNGIAITGTSFTVTQEIGTRTYLYRTAVLNLDNKVIYLMANPTKAFDFTDQEWKAIALRAGQRASQG